MTDNPNFIDPKYAKSLEYASTLSDLIKLGVCPFCPEHFPGTWHKNPVLHRTNDWLITRSTQPYTGASDHFIMFGQRHIETMSELSVEDFAAILALSQWATAEFHLPGGLLAMRFGDTHYTGASIKHVHAHLVVPEEIDGNVAVVNFPIG